MNNRLPYPSPPRPVHTSLYIYCGDSSSASIRSHRSSIAMELQCERLRTSMILFFLPSLLRLTAHCNNHHLSQEPSALLGVPEHLTQSFPPTENVVNAQEDAYHHRYYFSRKEGRNTGEDDCQDYFSNTTGLARDRLTTINSNDSVPILGGKECTLSSLRFSRQRAATTTVDRFGSGGRVGGGPCGVVVNQEGGTLPGVVEFGGTSPARQMVGFAGHPNHDHGGIGGGFKFNCEVGGSKRSGNSNCSRRGSKSNNDNSRRSTSSSSSNSDSALDGETIRAFAHRCLAESRTL